MNAISTACYIWKNMDLRKHAWNGIDWFILSERFQKMSWK